jgi:hypothetical protein
LTVLAAKGARAETTYGEVPLDAGGWVSGFAQHPGGRLYAFGDNFGVYRSDDFGAHWRFLQNSLQEDATTVYGLAVSPTDPSRVAFFGPSAIWNSDDSGETWTKRLGDLTAVTWRPEFQRTRGTQPLAYHPSQADELWVAATRRNLPGSLWRSADNGLTWSVVGGTTFAKEQVTTIKFSPKSPNHVWVGTGAFADRRLMGGLWCSVDGGTNWHNVWNNGGRRNKQNEPPQVNSIARNAAGVSVIATNAGLWQITATDWDDPKTYVATLRAFADQNVPNVTTLADGTFWASEIGDPPRAPLVSTDGITWTERPIKMSNAFVPEWATAEQIVEANRVYGRDMLVQDAKNPGRWLLTGAASAHLSEDNGITWRYQPGGMAGIASHGVDFDQTNPNRAYLATSDRGIFVINDGGLSGQTVGCSSHAFNEPHTFHETMTSADGQTIVAAGVHPGINRTAIIRSDDGGATWTKIMPRGLPLSYEGVTRAVMSLEDPNDFLVLLGYRFEHMGTYHDPEKGQPNSSGLYRTKDGGKSFVQVGGHQFEGADTGMRHRPEYSYLERDGVNPQIRYLTLRSPQLASVQGLWRSTDGGTTWQRRTERGGTGITAFAVDPTVEGRLWAGSSRLRRSDDGGGTWIDVGDFDAVTSVSCHAGRIALLGRRKGDEFNKIYASPDNGATWQKMTSDANRLMWARSVVADPWRAGQIWVTGSRSYQIINPPSTPDPLLSGTASGAPDAANAFDGSTETAVTTDDKGGFAGIDLGKGKSARVTAIRYFPRAGSESRMNGGRFEGSTDGTTWTPLANITNAPTAGWQTLAVANTGFFRHLRYIHPEGPADTAEVEFHGLSATAPTLAQTLPTVTGHIGQSLYYPVALPGYPHPTFKIASGQLPAGLWLNPNTGVITGTPTAAATGAVAVEATNSQGSKPAPVTFDIRFGPRLSVTTAAVYFQAAGTKGEFPLTLTNSGNEPLTWSVNPINTDWLGAIAPATEGTLAPGASATLSIAVNATGIANGKSVADAITFASNDPVHPALAVPVRLTASVAPAAPVIAQGQRPQGYKNGTFNYAIQASNSPTKWEITSGTLPAGTALDPASGIISGTPSEIGQFALKFTATNAGGTSPAGSLTLAISEIPTGADYNFDISQAHFEDTFLQTPGTPWASNAGVGGSGGLVADSNEHVAVLPEPTITFTTAGQSVKMGVAFKARVAEGTAGGDNMRLGLKRQNKLPLSGDFLNVGLNKAANEPLTSALVVDSRSAASAVATKDTDSLVLVNKHWYALETTITYDGSDNFTIVSNLYRLGERGTDKPELVDSYTTTRSGLGSMVNVPLFAGFSGRCATGFGGVEAFDNFFAKP